MKERVIILTKSAKLKNLCVAGIRWETGEWIRLENKYNDGGAISPEDMRYADGTMCDILDIVEVECTEESAVNYYQPENVYIETGKKWKKIGESNWHEVLRKHPTDTRRYLLNTKFCNMTVDYAQGINDQFKQSLQLVKVQNLVIEQAEKREDGTFKHPKASFDYINSKGERIPYHLTITDEDYSPATQGRVVGRCHLIVSLGVPFSKNDASKPHHYLLIAKIIEDLDDPYELTTSPVNGKPYYHYFSDCKFLKCLGHGERRSFGAIKRENIALCKECKARQEKAPEFPF